MIFMAAAQHLTPWLTNCLAQKRSVLYARNAHGAIKQKEEEDLLEA